MSTENYIRLISFTWKNFSQSTIQKHTLGSMFACLRLKCKEQTTTQLNWKGKTTIAEAKKKTASNTHIHLTHWRDDGFHCSQLCIIHIFMWNNLTYKFFPSSQLLFIVAAQEKKIILNNVSNEQNTKKNYVRFKLKSE
jgi:hypothetical protein